MPTIQQIQQQRTIEQRSIGRTFINRNALMSFSGQAGMHSCCVRDVTNYGAGIRLNGLLQFPNDPQMSSDLGDGDWVGVTFKS
jgi:hypothetical protein